MPEAADLPDLSQVQALSLDDPLASPTPTTPDVDPLGQEDHPAQFEAPPQFGMAVAEPMEIPQSNIAGAEAALNLPDTEPATLSGHHGTPAWEPGKAEAFDLPEQSAAVTEPQDFQGQEPAAEAEQPPGPAAEGAQREEGDGGLEVLGKQMLDALGRIEALLARRDPPTSPKREEGPIMHSSPGGFSYEAGEPMPDLAGKVHEQRRAFKAELDSLHTRGGG